MKVKYSNMVGKKLPWSLLQECLLLTYTVIPSAGLHYFHLESLNNKTYITHRNPKLSYECKVISSKSEVAEVNEDLVIYRNNFTIYALMLNEFEGCNCSNTEVT